MKKALIKAKHIEPGDTIGIIAPSIALKPEYIENPVANLKKFGFEIKLSENLFSETNGYAGSITERATDFNEMIADRDVKMILFGGGEVCNEILPYIDYDNIKRNPKIICSYSDSTSILNAVYSKTGLVTFYGCSLRTFERPTDYNIDAFTKRLMTTDLEYAKGSKWTIIHPGSCEGILTGGYLVNYAALQGLEYFTLSQNDKYLLFIEDHEKFSSPAVVSKWFSNLEHRGVFKFVSGLIFGHYSDSETPLIDDILFRIGKRYGIPVVRCEDFGHGINNTIIPIGVCAKLNTEKELFRFIESSVT